MAMAPGAAIRKMERAFIDVSSYAAGLNVILLSLAMGVTF
jgi:hypothetical protein